MRSIQLQIIIGRFLLILVLQCILIFAGAQNSFRQVPLSNKKIPIKQPISQARITDILEDQRGFMWFATNDGLNRYDGYEIKIFRHSDSDTNSISNSQVFKLLEDKDGFIWIVTAAGIDKFDPYQELFYHCRFTKPINNRPDINDISFDKDQNLWLGTTNGLYLIKYHSLEMKPIELDISFMHVESLKVDHQNQLWIGSGSYIINRYDIDTKTLKNYPINALKNVPYLDLISSIYEDVNGKIWFSAYYNKVVSETPSIFYFDKQQDKIMQFKDMQDVISENDLETMFSAAWEFESEKNVLWAASTQASIAKFDFGKGELVHYPEYENLLWHKEIGKSKLYIDSKGLLWVGTNGDGVFILPLESNNFNLVNIDLYNQITQKSIRSFCEDEEYYWFGGYFGIGKIDKQTGAISNLRDEIIAYSMTNFPGDSSFLLVGSEGGGLQKLNKKTAEQIPLFDQGFYNVERSRPWVWIFSILEEQDSLCWAGCLNGIIKWNYKTDTFKTYDLLGNQNDFSGQIFCLYRDFSGKLWACSDRKGLGYHSVSQDKFISYKHPYSEYVDMENLRVNCITQTKDSVYWLGTSSGLMRMDHTSIKVFNEDDDLTNDFVYAVVIDDNGLLWLSTNNGISSFNPIDYSVNNYSENEGLQDKEFNTGAYFKSQDGRIFFGGINGFNHFLPNEIHQNLSETPIVLTGVKCNNEYLRLAKEMVTEREIEIPADVDYFSVEFAGINYLNAQGNSYKYYIDNLTQDWVALGNKNEIGFHSLDPGVYDLNILAANNHGKWNKQAYVLKIVVLARYWETIYFKMGVLFLIIAITFIAVFERFKLIRKQKAQVEELVEQRTHELNLSNENLNKANQTKDQFFSIISHDLKNPISASLSVTSELKENFKDYTKEEQQTFISILDSSMINLSSLLENLLTWSRVQQEKILPSPQMVNVNHIIFEVKDQLLSNIKEKSLEIVCTVSESIQVYADKNMLSAILRNILSNAIKFTPNEGRIVISTKESSSNVIIQISDNGIGMSTKTLKNLFIPGRTMSAPGTNNESGTGMGLLLISDFVRLNKGEIWVDSKEGVGSNFYVSLPNKYT